MSSSPKLTALVRQPDALRGLDHLIEQARRVLDRYMRIPAPKPEQKVLPRVA
jgi:hypothetical protein